MKEVPGPDEISNWVLRECRGQLAKGTDNDVAFDKRRKIINTLEMCNCGGNIQGRK